LSETIQFYVGTAHKEDPRYFRKGEGSMGGRTLHVFKNTFFSHRADASDRMTPALGRIAGSYGAWGIAMQWIPAQHQTWGQFFLYGSVGMATKAGSNAMREFWPDVKRKFFTKKQNSAGSAQTTH